MIYPLFLWGKKFLFINEYVIFVENLIKRKIMNKHLLAFVFLWMGISTQFCAAQVSTPKDSFEGYEVTDKGSWCWFADPRALHHESKDGSINKTYLGYIDVHGNIKALQIDWKTRQKEEVLIRSWF